jgi:hypothetical protein
MQLSFFLYQREKIKIPNYQINVLEIPNKDKLKCVSKHSTYESRMQNFYFLLFKSHEKIKREPSFSFAFN